jgi:predicted aminopeptidase
VNHAGRLSSILALVAALSGGCITTHAAIQDAEGELTLLAHRKPIPEVIARRRTPRRVRALLVEIPDIKRFAVANGLRATENYQDYVELHRSAVVYVVSACEPLRFHSKTWSFPIVGEFPYLGWFNLRSAQDYARDLEGDGWDVDLRGASAYSTLGWFHDPVLSTMIEPGPEALGDLVDVILHESVHATLHIGGQAVFNESLASFVADRLTQRYLDSTRGTNSLQRRAWDDARARSEVRARELHAAYEELAILYASPLPDDEKRARKVARLSALQARLQMKRRITNATLVQHRTYSAGVVGFERVLDACGGDFRCFLQRVRMLTPRSFSRPEQDDLDPVLLQLAAVSHD